MSKFTYEERFHALQMPKDVDSEKALKRFGLETTASLNQIVHAIDGIWPSSGIITGGNNETTRIELLDLLLGSKADIMQVADSESTLGQAYRAQSAFDAAAIIVRAELDNYA